MKHAFRLLLLFAALLSPVAARADGWADLEEVAKDFYLIDKAAAGPITCHVSNSQLDEFMQKVPSVGNMIADQIDSFRVTVRPDGNIVFVTPRTNIPFGTLEGAQTLKKGLAAEIGETKKIVWNLLKNLMAPKREEVSDITVSRKDGKVTTSVTMIDYDGVPARIETTLTGDTDVTKQTEGEEVAESESKYTKLDGKLAPVWQKMHSNRKEGAVDGEARIKYQQVGKVWFPSQLVSDAHVGPKLTPVHAVISFTDCTGP